MWQTAYCSCSSVCTTFYFEKVLSRQKVLPLLPILILQIQNI